MDIIEGCAPFVLTMTLEYSPEDTESSGNGGTTTQSDNAPQGHWVRKRVRRNALPNTGDNATSIAMLGGMILSGLTIIATARKMRR